MPLADFDQGVARRLQDPSSPIDAITALFERSRQQLCSCSAPRRAPRGALYNPEMDKKTAKPTPRHHRATPPRPAAPELSEKQRRYLRGLAHPLKPVILLGKEGLTDAVGKETARALHDHELIKVKGLGGDREARDAAFTALAERTGSALVHRIGNVAVLYRPRPDLKRI